MQVITKLSRSYKITDLKGLQSGDFVVSLAQSELSFYGAAFFSTSQSGFMKGYQGCVRNHVNEMQPDD